MTSSHVFGSAIVDVFGVLFIDGIVCEMDVASFHVTGSGFYVLLSCESSQALFIDVQSHWVSSTEKNVHSEVKFETLD